MIDLNIIKQKINNCDFEKIKYIYPSLPNDSLGKYVSGFSNNGDGLILFGVKDDGNELEVKGFSDDDNQIKNFISSNFPNSNVEFKKFSLDGKNLFLIEVKKTTEMIPYNNILYMMKKNSRNRYVTMEIMIQKVFLSYCHKDKSIMKIIKVNLEHEKYLNLIVDEDQLEYKNDLEEYMKTIKQHDFVISIISDSYLKSKNCMYEITELMKDDHYMNKLLFIILSDDDRKFYDAELEKNISIEPNIYDLGERIKYIQYWKNKEEELKNQINNIKDISLLPELPRHLNTISIITRHVDSLLEKISTQLSISFQKMYICNFEDIKKKILEKIY